LAGRVLYGVVCYRTSNIIAIYEATNPEKEKVCKIADKALESVTGSDHFGDVITQVIVLGRTI
jgi:hypothetical protein